MKTRASQNFGTGCGGGAFYAQYKLTLAITLLLLCQMAFALDPARQITQHAHTAWRLQDGSFSGIPGAITQTTDGYIWLGTDAGLLRFDGVRFVPWNPPAELQDRSHAIFSLLATPDGSLYIGMGSWLLRLRNGTTETLGDHGGVIEDIVQDSHGHIWIGRAHVRDGALPFCRLDGAAFLCYGRSSGLSSATTGTLAAGRGDDVWIGTPSSLARWSKGRIQEEKLTSLSRSSGLTGVEGLVWDNDKLWVGFHHAGPGLGLEQFQDGQWRSVTTVGFDSSSLEVTSLMKGRHGELWVGTATEGIFCLHEGKVQHYGSSDGLSSDSIFGFHEDVEGNVWITTAEGLDNLRDLPIVSFSKRQGLTADDVGSVQALAHGEVLIGNDGALDRYHDHVITALTPARGLPGRKITSLFYDREMRLWVGVDSDLYRMDGSRFLRVTDKQGGTGIVIAMTEDRNGNLWARTVTPSPNLLEIEDLSIVNRDALHSKNGGYDVAASSAGGVWTTLTDGSVARLDYGQVTYLPGLAEMHLGSVTVLHEDASGTLWGVTRHGLLSWDGHRINVLGQQNGLPCSVLYSLAEDLQQNLWLGSSCGLIKVSHDELTGWLHAPQSTVHPLLLGPADGVHLSSSYFRPTATTSSDGRLWFATNTLLEMVDPANLHTNPIPPMIHVEELTANHAAHYWQSHASLPVLTKDLQIDYTALSFVQPQQVRFKYMLEGWDAAWQDAGSRRSAFYTNLTPGRYVFRVIACNNSGLWNDAGASFAFAIPPAWNQTKWFRFLCLCAVLLLLFTIYHIQLRRQAAASQIRLDERLGERTRVARDLHDTLMQTIQVSRLVAEDALEHTGDVPYQKDSLTRLVSWLERATNEGRLALNSLRDHAMPGLDIAAALESACREQASGSDCKPFVVSDGEFKLVHPIVAEECLRIGREAITNALKHSGAKNLRVQIRYGTDFAISISDDGCGMPATVVQDGKVDHFGFIGMRERARIIRAQLSIASSPDRGTTVYLTVPGHSAYL